jgi:hypothetical protein
MGGVEKKKLTKLGWRNILAWSHILSTIGEHTWQVLGHLGPPCLCTYLMGSGCLVPSFFLKDSMHSVFQALKLCPRLLCLWDISPSD